MFTNNREGEYTKLNNQIVATADEKGSNQQKNIKKSNNGHNKHLRKPERPSEMRGIYQQLCIFMLALVSLAVTTCEALPQQECSNGHEVNTADDLNDSALMKDENLENSKNRPEGSLTAQKPSIFYLETLIIVDYDTYVLHGRNESEVKRYFTSFWHAVDLRFRLLKDPEIRIIIVGIIISKSPDDTPYLKKNRLDRNDLNMTGALIDMGKYMFRVRGLPHYDIAVTITKVELCNGTSAYGNCSHIPKAMSYLGGACMVNEKFEEDNSVAIIEDTGGFSGIIVAAHELGHLLGATHDGSPPVSYLGGPGSQQCCYDDGYIMSKNTFTERYFRWSPCTVESFRHFLKSGRATCLYNVPHVVSGSEPPLPGTLQSLDNQCQRDFGSKTCYTDARVCVVLHCYDADSALCLRYRPAAEGSPCGKNMHCLDGRCTPLPNYG